MLGQDSHNNQSRGGVGGEVRLPAAITDTGCERDLNEDRYSVIESLSGVAWIVCDGMGGQAGGELAAQLAIDAIRREFEATQRRSPEAALKSAILEANRIIVLRRQNQAFANMGTTIVGVLFSDREVALAHVGDSRAYLIRGDAIQQLTVDHTYVQQLVDAGQISSEEALSHPQAHILTKCIGSEPGLAVSLEKYWLWESGENEDRDTLMLCSDGLYSLVTEQEMLLSIRAADPQQACLKLVEIAKGRGGYDNITIAVIPLSGQLRKEPPVGYQEEMQKKRQRELSRALGMTFAGTSMPRFVGIVLALSCLAALITIFFVMVMIRGA